MEFATATCTRQIYQQNIRRRSKREATWLGNAPILGAMRQWRSAAEARGVDVQRVRVVDAFSITEGRCDATPVTDGRHYRTLIPAELKSMLQCLN